MATKYFAGNSLASFSRSGTGSTEDTTSGRFDSAYVPYGLNVASGEYIQTAPFGSVTGTVWTHFEYYHIGAGVSAHNLTFYNGGAPVVKMENNAFSSTMVVYYWNGSAWVSNGTTWTAAVATLTQVDFKLVLNTSWEIYVNKVSVASGSSLLGGTTITNVQFNAAGGTVFSQVLMADFDTRNEKYMQVLLNGNSASNTGGTGSYTTVNENSLDDTTYVSIGTTGNKHGQTHATLSVPSGYQISAAVLNARARVSGTITDGKLGYRIGSTNYSSSARGFTSTFGPATYILDNDPSTSATWTQSGFNAAEVFEEAV